MTRVLNDLERWAEVSRAVDFDNDEYPADRPLPS